MGAFLLLPFARRLRGKAALRGGCFVCRGRGALSCETVPALGGCLPARRQRALCLAKPRLSWAGVCPPAASGRFALRNRACLGLASARPPPAGALPCETMPALGGCLPACRQRALCLTKLRLSWAGVCPPAASGHFALQSRTCLGRVFAPPAASGRFALRNRACFGRVFARLPPAGTSLCRTALVLGGCLPACRQRALCLAKPHLSWAGVCPPAASGHFALQSRTCLGQVFAPPAASGHFALQNRTCLELASARPPPAGILLCETAPALGGCLPACRQMKLAPPRHAGHRMPGMPPHPAPAERLLLHFTLPAWAGRLFPAWPVPRARFAPAGPRRR